LGLRRSGHTHPDISDLVAIERMRERLRIELHQGRHLGNHLASFLGRFSRWVHLRDDYRIGFQGLFRRSRILAGAFFIQPIALSSRVTADRDPHPGSNRAPGLVHRPGVFISHEVLSAYAGELESYHELRAMISILTSL